MEWLIETFQQYPELAIFLTLALGYWIGSLKFGKFNLGRSPVYCWPVSWWGR